MKNVDIFHMYSFQTLSTSEEQGMMLLGSKKMHNCSSFIYVFKFLPNEGEYPTQTPPECDVWKKRQQNIICNFQLESGSLNVEKIIWNWICTIYPTLKKKKMWPCGVYLLG